MRFCFNSNIFFFLTRLFLRFIRLLCLTCYQLGHSTRMYENAKSEFENLLRHRSEENRGFYRLTVLLMHFDERERVSLS